jgi:hypothetical protein
MTDGDSSRIQDLAAFAGSRGWSYAATAAPPALSGELWEQVTSGVVHDRVAGADWEAGHLRGGTRTASRAEVRGDWTVTTSVSASTPAASLDLGYLALTLPRRLPHLLLDSRRNDGLLSTLQHAPRQNQRLRLEGDFDTHFRLYCPRGYERDALYVFTPDLMALLIDETGDLDVEVRDDRLIVYRPGGFDLGDPATWRLFERIRETVGAKLRSGTDLYRDERTGLGEAATGEVGPEGRRLKRRLPRLLWVGIAVGLAVVAFAVTIVTIVLSAVLRSSS